MKPVDAKELLKLDPEMQVIKLQSYPNPEQVVWQAGKTDYSEDPIHYREVPVQSKCGEWIVDQLLSNDRGHYGCLEHPQITLSCSGFVHNVMVQARTHRIGTTWDCQSQRYTGKRVEKVARGELDVKKVFYVRPPGFYINRQGKKYQWTEDHYNDELHFCKQASIRYADKSTEMAEEHLRDYLPQSIRQNFTVSFNLRSVLHFLDLRAKKDAQLEIQALCESIVPILKVWAPSVWNYYEEKRLYRAKLSP